MSSERNGTGMYCHHLYPLTDVRIGINRLQSTPNKCSSFNVGFVELLCGLFGSLDRFFNLTPVRTHSPDFPLLVFICLLPTAFFQYIYGVQNVSIEPVNDVSTNLSDPPQLKLSQAKRQSPYYNQNIFFYSRLVIISLRIQI
jgi:hypothetical protein